MRSGVGFQILKEERIEPSHVKSCAGSVPFQHNSQNVIRDEHLL
jgi:hypothetical protein